MITAEEFMTQHDSMRMPRGVTYQKEIGEAMIEFAKLHVEAALKAASEKSCIQIDEHELSCSVDKKSILNSYPLTNIK